MDDAAPFVSLERPGQGVQIPEALGQGAWIIEPEMYLSYLDHPEGSGSVRNGDGPIPIDANRLALKLKTTTGRLVEANRKGELAVGSRMIESEPGGPLVRQLLFTFLAYRAILTPGEDDE